MSVKFDIISEKFLIGEYYEESNRYTCSSLCSFCIHIMHKGLKLYNNSFNNNYNNYCFHNSFNIEFFSFYSKLDNEDCSCCNNSKESNFNLSLYCFRT